MAEGGEAAAGADEGEEKKGRSCTEVTLDFFACMGRGAVATGSAVKWTTRYACYPLKEGVVKCYDRTADHMTPYLKKETAMMVPEFSVGLASDSQFPRASADR
mmetsp:Transcript_36538/g.96295  ORF Transcript_36538/g.96295 Transcript_36538/m.96295 type:complete len:103 (-) Transcript_36538:43-351(-)